VKERSLRRQPGIPIPAPSDVLTPVVVWLLVIALAWLALIAALAHGDLLSWDEPLRARLREWDSDWFAKLMRASTRLGSRSFIAVLTIPIALAAWRRCRQLAVVLVAAFPVALALEVILKALVDRPRPPLALGFGASFPSGHVLAATAFWGLLPPLTFLVTRSRRAWLMSVAIVTLILVSVGASRVYLGAHWPSDVVGAYLAGAVFLLSAEWVVRRRWRRFRCEACDLHPLVGSLPRPERPERN